MAKEPQAKTTSSRNQEAPEEQKMFTLLRKESEDLLDDF